MIQPSTSDEEQRNEANGTVSLSHRQTQVLALVAKGETDNEMALELSISPLTVAWYVREIRARLDARSRAHAVALALQQGILPGPWTRDEIPSEDPDRS
jgi:DNA-binding CsgD family transcriptional regulator